MLTSTSQPTTTIAYQYMHDVHQSSCVFNPEERIENTKTQIVLKKVLLYFTVNSSEVAIRGAQSAANQCSYLLKACPYNGQGGASRG